MSVKSEERVYLRQVIFGVLSMGTQRGRRLIKTLWRGERQEIHAYNILRKRKNHAKLFKKEAMID
jgi:hypothetical protein